VQDELSTPAPARRVSLRALLVSCVVLAVGAAVGAAGFALEQSRVTWRPQVAATDDGWRISTSHGLRLGAAALGPAHVVWNAGPFTLLTDLEGGDSKLLGARAFAGDLSAPSTSARYVTWLDVHYQGPSVVWVYDTVSKRRVQLEGTEGVQRSPVLAGPVAIWAVGLPDGGGSRVVGEDLRSGTRSVIAESPVVEDLVAAGDLAAWISRPASAEPPVITVADVRSGARRQVAPYTTGGGTRLVGFAVAGRHLVWARDAGPGTAGQIVAFNVDTGAVSVLAAAEGPISVAGGGDLVVWAERPSTAEPRVLGVRPSEGAPFVVAILSGAAPTDVYASGAIAAWRVSPDLLFDSYLQTAAISGAATASQGAATASAERSPGQAGRSSTAPPHASPALGVRTSGAP
jgi:hypothetical protein